MRLKDALNNFDEKTLIYLSSGTSFIFIGNKHNLVKDVEKISADFLRSYKKSLKYSRRWVRTYKQNLDNKERRLKCLKDDLRNKRYEDREAVINKIHFYESRIKNMPLNKKVNQGIIDKYSDYVKNWVDIIDREIVEIYDRTAYSPGKIIKVEGMENGAYWFDYEYKSQTSKRKYRK